MSTNDDENANGGNTLGEAANRYVTFQIVSAIIGGIVFLIILFTVFLPMFNRTNQSMSNMTNSAPMSPETMPGQMGSSTTLTINGRPATPEEHHSFDQQTKQSPP